MFLDIQDPKVFYKKLRFKKNWLLKCGLRLLKKWIYVAVDYFEKNIAKKYHKQQFSAFFGGF